MMVIRRLVVVMAIVFVLCIGSRPARAGAEVSSTRQDTDRRDADNGVLTKPPKPIQELVPTPPGSAVTYEGAAPNVASPPAALSDSKKLLIMAVLGVALSSIFLNWRSLVAFIKRLRR
jgi:hypothetical protein